MCTLIYLKWITNKNLLCSTWTLPNVMWQRGWEGSLEKNGHLSPYGWVPSLLTWNYHNTINYTPTQNKKFKRQTNKKKNGIWNNIRNTQLPSLRNQCYKYSRSTLHIPHPLTIPLWQWLPSWICVSHSHTHLYVFSSFVCDPKKRVWFAHVCIFTNKWYHVMCPSATCFL